MLLLLKKIINRTQATSKRPTNSVFQLKNNSSKWGNYVSFHTVNAVIFVIDFFIEKLEESAIRPNKRLLKITELNLIELYDLKQSILAQIASCKITLDQKDCFIIISTQQRQDINCLFSDYELKIAKIYTQQKEFYKLSQEFDMITKIRIEINNMLEIKPYDN